jgi:hypothetical protein
MSRSFWLAPLLVVALGGTALAVPHTVSFTARITDTSGTPVEGAIDLKVQVYDAAQDGTMLWEETHTGVPAEKGLVYASLGGVDTAGNGLDDVIFDGRPMFLQLIVDGDALSPRIPLASVPYALRAGALDNFDPTGVQKKITGACATGTFVTAVDSNGAVVCGNDQVGTGDITGVGAGAGLSGGGTSGSVSLSVDTAAIQSRVTGSCATGTFITAVNQNGTVVCGNDQTGTGDITGVSGTGGITGGGTSGSVSLGIDNTVIQSRVTGGCGTGTFITAINQNGSVACGTDQVGTGDITSVGVSGGITGGGTSGAISLGIDNTVVQSRVTGTCGTGTFITAVGQNGAVTCGADQVGTGDITGVTANGGLTGGGTSGAVTVSILDGGVSSAKLADGSVVAGKIGASAVTTAEILDGTIGAADLATGSVTTAKIATNAVTTAKIADGSVTMAKTSGPIGQDAFTGFAGSVNYGATSITADSAGSCYVTAWSRSTSNATIGVEPSMLTVSTNASTYYNAAVGSYYGSGGLFGYQSQSSAVFNVASGAAYRFGCHVEGSGNVECRVTWICN